MRKKQLRIRWKAVSWTSATHKIDVQTFSLPNPYSVICYCSTFDGDDEDVVMPTAKTMSTAKRDAGRMIRFLLDNGWVAEREVK